MQTRPLGIAVVGCGYWGINYVRLLLQLPGVKCVAICEKSESRLSELAQRFPDTNLVSSMDELLKLDDFDAVVVCTNPGSHYEVTHRLLKAGKHILVEKPMTKSSADAQDLINLATTNRTVLMVGHIFIYNPGIEKLKSYIDTGSIGDMHYMYARRTNLGPIRDDVNALWDLAPHDIYIFNYLLNSKPEWVSAVAAKFLHRSMEDAGFITLGYPGGILGNIHVSWADPHKEREIVVVGSNQRVVFNDILMDGKVRVFEKGVEAKKETSSFGEYQLCIHDGDIIIPKLSVEEPLKNQVSHFIACIKEGKPPRSSGIDGLDVVRIMEAVDISVGHRGIPVVIT